MKTSDFMVKEVMKYRGKGFLIIDNQVGNILRICMMKMEQRGKSGEEYLQRLFKDELRNYAFAQAINPPEISAIFI